MSKQTKTDGNYIVTKEDKVICGADWRQNPNGQKVTVTEVLLEHDNFTEIILPTDPRFRVAVNKTWGGKRPGAGRKPSGRTTHNFYITDAEAAQVRALIESLRK